MAKEFSLNTKRFKKKLKKLERFANTRFPRKVLKKFKDNTPKDRGNARKKTKLKRRTGGWEIVGDYPYSGVIDKGLYPNPPQGGAGKTRNGYSTQAPQGIVEPTLKEAEKIFNDYARRIR